MPTAQRTNIQKQKREKQRVKIGTGTERSVNADPEMRSGNIFWKRPWIRTDRFSLGCLLWAMGNGQLYSSNQNLSSSPTKSPESEPPFDDGLAFCSSFVGVGGVAEFEITINW